MFLNKKGNIIETENSINSDEDLANLPDIQSIVANFSNIDNNSSDSICSKKFYLIFENSPAPESLLIPVFFTLKKRHFQRSSTKLFSLCFKNLRIFFFFKMKGNNNLNVDDITINTVGPRHVSNKKNLIFTLFQPSPETLLNTVFL